MKYFTILLLIPLMGCMARVDANNLAEAAKECKGYANIHRLEGLGLDIRTTCKKSYPETNQ